LLPAVIPCELRTRYDRALKYRGKGRKKETEEKETKKGEIEIHNLKRET
jgi:hypothetical protein